MSDTSDFLKRVSKRTGFKREFYIEKNIPTEPSNILAIPFFGDFESLFILSSLILKPFKEKNYDKYIILCSWPGMQSLFPCVDEYWTIDDPSLLSNISLGSNGFFNNSNISAELTKSLSEVLNIFTSRDIHKIYNKGFTSVFWQDFKEIKRFLPEINSFSSLQEDIKRQFLKNEGRKIVIYPSLKMNSWQRGISVSLPIIKDFWIYLVEKLIKNNFDVVVYQNYFTHDVSKEFADRCVYLNFNEISKILSCIREAGLLLDIHSGISRFAIAARCPYLAVVERQIFVYNKVYEVDDLCAKDLQKKYIFSFASQTTTCSKEEWDVTVLDNVFNKLNSFLPEIDYSKIPSTASSYDMVSHDNIRNIVSKRLGTHFIKTSKNK
jgi:hypothetical protein